MKFFELFARTTAGVITLYPVDCEEAVIFRGTFEVEQA